MTRPQGRPANIAAEADARVAAVVAERDALGARLRDLTRRLGFGDNINEPMADNDTIVKWFDEQGRDATEWHEHELWRNDCYAAGHPDDDDCDEHGPTCCNRTHAAAVVAAVEALADEWRRELDSGVWRDTMARHCWGMAERELRAALAPFRATDAARMLAVARAGADDAARAAGAEVGR